jgi:hypothetical protein
MPQARKVKNPRESVYARPVLQRPAIRLLEQMMSAPIEVYLAQDRWVMCNATAVWRNLFNVNPGDKADDHAMSRHPEYWYCDNKDADNVQTVLMYLADIGVEPECAYHIKAGNVQLNPWLLVEYVSTVVPEYAKALKDMENDDHYENDDL